MGHRGRLIVSEGRQELTNHNWTIGVLVMDSNSLKTLDLGK